MSIDSEKRKQSHGVIMFIHFPTLSLNLSTKDVTITFDGIGVDFEGLIRRRGMGSISQEIAEGINSPASTVTLGITATDYRGTLRAGLLENSGVPLTDKPANAYFKFDDGSNTESASLLLLSGVVREYSASRDLLNIKIETQPFYRMGEIPADLVSSLTLDGESNSDFCIPIQYGNFNWGNDPLFFAEDGNSFAICPYLKTYGGEHIFVVAGHAMADVPTYVQASSVSNLQLYLKRKGRLVGFTRVMGGTTTDPTYVDGGITYLRVNDNHNGYYITSFKELYDGGAVENSPNASDCIDGKENTSATVSGGESLTYRVWDSQLMQTQTTQRLEILAHITKINGSGGTNVVTVNVRQISDNTVISTATFPAGSISLNAWTSVITILDSGELANLENYYFEFIPLDSYAIDIKQISLRYRVDPFTLDTLEESAIYLRCRGREFSGTWGSRKTSGAVITNPIDALESVFRDEYGAEINTGDFDLFNAVFSGAQCGFSLVRKQSAETFLQEFCEAMNLSVIVHPDNRFGLVMPDHSLNFSYSDNATAQNADIFTDTVDISNGAFVQVPIKRGSFTTSLTSAKEVITRLNLQYQQTLDGDYLRVYTKDSGATPVIEKTIKNRFIGNYANIEILGDFIHAWKSKAHVLCEFETFYDVIDIKVGQIIQIRHGDLSTSQLGEATSVSKWIVSGFSKVLNNGTIKIKAIHIPTTAAMGSF